MSLNGKLFSFLMIFTIICFTHETNHFVHSNSFNSDDFYKAALDVISMHGHSNEYNYRENYDLRQTKEVNSEMKNENHGSRRKRSVLSNDITFSDDIINKFKSRILYVQILLQTITESINNAIKSKSSILFSVPQIFENIEILGNVITHIHIEEKNIVWQNSPLVIEDLNHRIPQLRQKIDHITDLLNKLNQLTPDIVLRNEPTVIKGHKTIYGHSEISSINCASLSIDVIGRHDTTKLLAQLYRLNRSHMPIRGIKQMVKSIFIDGSINANLINGMDIMKDAVIGIYPQVITGPIKFNRPLHVTHDLQINGKLNHLNLINEIIFLNESRVIMTPKFFTSSISIVNGAIGGTIDGVDLTHLMNNALFTMGNQIIMGRKIFNGPVESNSIIVDREVNGIDISLMAMNLVYTNRISHIKGRKTFVLDNVIMRNDLFVNGLLDGRKIPDDLMLPHVVQHIISPKHFIGIITFDDELIIEGQIDGLHLPYDIVTLTKNEIINGPIIFREGITVRENIIAKQFVDGVDISELSINSLKMNDRKIIGNVRFTNVIEVNTIDIDQTVNGVELNHLYNDVIFVNAITDTIEITGTKKFTFPVQMEKVIAHYLNGYVITDFVSTFRDETITSKIIFEGFTVFNNTRISGLIDNVNVEHLFHNRISLSQSEHIYGQKIFQNELNVESLTVMKAIGGVIPRVDLVVKSVPQHITAPKIFTKNVNFGSLIVKAPLIVIGKFDNVLIHNVIKERIPINGHIPSSVILINCSAPMIEVTSDINRINIDYFANHVMSLTKPQNITAQITFGGDQFVSEMITERGVNRVLLKVLDDNAIHLKGNNEIIAPFTFAHNLIFENPVFVNGYVNGVNITQFSHDTVYINSPIPIHMTGNNHFLSGFTVYGDIQANYVNTVDLSRTVLTKTRDHIISSEVTFRNSLSIGGNVIINGKINGIVLSEFDRNVFKTNRMNRVRGTLEFMGPTLIESNLNVYGHINQINITQIFIDSVFLNGDQEIDEIKVIEAPVHFNHGLMTHQINGANVNHLIEEIILIDNPIEQHILFPMNFTSEVIANEIHQIRGFTFIETINNVHLMTLNLDSVRINEEIELHGISLFRNLTIVTNPIELFGKINDINLIHDVILTHHMPEEMIQVIGGRKSFQNITLINKMHIKGTVNDVNLRSMALDTMYSIGDQIFEGRTVVNGIMTVKRGNITAERLNGELVNEEFVTLNGDQLLYNNWLFNGTLIINNHLNVHRFINGVNITKLEIESMHRNRSELISEPINLSNAVFRNDVRVEGHVDTVDLSLLLDDAKRFTSIVNTSKELMVQTVHRHRLVSDYMHKMLENSIYQINHFELYQVIDGVYGEMINVNSEREFSINKIKDNSATAYTLKYTLSNGFELKMVTHQLPVIERKVFNFAGEEYVINLNKGIANVSAELTKNGLLIGSLGYFVKSVESNVIERYRFVIIASVTRDDFINIFVIHLFDDNGLQFKHLGSFRIGKEIIKAVPFLMNGNIYISVARRDNNDCIYQESGVLIFIMERNAFRLVQRIPLSKISDIVYFEHNFQHYLAFSDVSSVHHTQSPQTIYIYRTEMNDYRCHFSLFQKLYFDDATQLCAFSFGTINYPQTFLAAANKSSIIIWQQMGESGFIKNWPLNIENGRVIKPILVANHLFIIVGQNCHESLIFKAEMNGATLLPVILKQP